VSRLKGDGLPRRGDVWLTTPDPVVGREQSGRRPVLVVSADPVNRAPSQLVLAVPITTRRRGITSHIPIAAGEGGLDHASLAMGEQLRSLSQERLERRLGRVAPRTLAAVEAVLRRLLSL
jgi:mRNA interferase MazF